MKDRISALAKGKFEYVPIPLQLSPKQLQVLVVSGKKCKGTFLIENERGTIVKGFVTGTRDCHIVSPTFCGEKNEIAYSISAEGKLPGEKIQGQLTVVTDCGEAALPYYAQVVEPVLQDERGVIHSFEEFVSRAKLDFDQASSLFSKDTFRQMFLASDQAGQISYEHLRKHNSPILGLEEFLVAAGVKPAVHFEIEKKEFTFDSQKEERQEWLNLSVNTWGNVGIRVSSDVDFIRVPNKLYSAGDFIGGENQIPFRINGKNLAAGIHRGHILIQSPFQSEKIDISIHNREESKRCQEKLAYQKRVSSLFRATLFYRMDKLPKDGYVSLITGYGDVSRAVEACGQILSGQREMAEQFVLELERKDRPEVDSNINEVVEYLLGRFACSLYSGQQTQKEKLVEEVRYYYENGFQQWQLFVMLLNWDEKYNKLPIEMVFSEAKEYLQEGIRSPFFLYEIIKLYNRDLTLIHQLDENNIAIVYWGLKHSLFQKEFALHISMLVERVTGYSELLFRCLGLQYRQYRLEDTLHCICSMLIRQEKMDARFFPWFEQGVALKLRITELYEYYMCTRNPAEKHPIPHSVILYFQYENHLGSKVKTQLFSYIVFNKDKLPEDYQAYKEQIHKFAHKQLMQGMVSQELGVIYEDLIQEEGPQEALPAVMFKCQITCSNPRMDTVRIVHCETNQEQTVPLVNGKALVDIYTSNYQIYFWDRDGSCYMSTVPCELVKITKLDQYAFECFEKGSNHPYIIFHLLEKIMKGYTMNEQQALLCHVALKANVLRDFFKAKVVNALYDYYISTGNEEMLKKVLAYYDPKYVNGHRRQEMIDRLIQHEMFEPAFEAISTYGFEGCQKPNLVSLATYELEQHFEEYNETLLFLIVALCRNGCQTKEMIHYLLPFYMGSVQEMGKIFQKAEVLGVDFTDEDYEKLLAQVLFVQANPLPYVRVFMKYYEGGKNRVLVKAFLSYVAYGYVVDKYNLDATLFALIKKESLGIRNDILVLAILKYQSCEEKLSQEQKEYADYEIGSFAKSGVVLPFMQKYRGRVVLPYSVDNSVIISHYANTVLPVNVVLVDETGEQEIPMREILPGVFVRTFLLFYGETVPYYIQEEESGRRTEPRTMQYVENNTNDRSFYSMVNEMEKHKEQSEQVDAIRAEYEKYRQLGEKLFQIL